MGKTTLLLQMVDQLLQEGVHAGNILYVTFDHPIFTLAGLDSILEAWQELEPKANGSEYLFLDEAQFIKDFGTWVKHQIDFSKNKKIVFTGSAMPLIEKGSESGVGRWHVLPTSTLSFYEYLQIKKITFPAIPKVRYLADLFSYSTKEFYTLTQATQELVGHFHEYLLRGGFPQTALIGSIAQAQKLLREDIIDKILKRDMTALFGVRRVVELEQTFIYLCMHDGGIQDLQTLSSNLGITKHTVQNFINLLEASHLLYRLQPFGYGKEILRGRHKLYLADPAIAPAVLMKGKAVLEDAITLGSSVEASVFAHLRTHCAFTSARFSYWKNQKNKELDLVMETANKIIPLEVKYQSKMITSEEIPGLIDFCLLKGIAHGYVVTKLARDIGIMANHNKIPLMRIPAPILCYWLGEAEVLQKNIFIQEN